VRFRAIEALADRYPVAPMCRLLRVSRSGFYAWQQRPPSTRGMANRRLSKEIRTIHYEVNGIYGHLRIKAELAAVGHACGRHRAARLMREAGLSVRSRKRWRLVSSSRHALPIAPNHLDRQFASDHANRHWVSDMTYVRTSRSLRSSPATLPNSASFDHNAEQLGAARAGRRDRSPDRVIRWCREGGW